MTALLMTFRLYSCGLGWNRSVVKKERWLCVFWSYQSFESGATHFVTVTSLKHNKGGKKKQLHDESSSLCTIPHFTMLMQRCVIRVSRVCLCCGKVPQAFIQSLSSSSCVHGLTLLSSLIPPWTYDKISSFSFVSPPCLTGEPSSSLAGPLFMKPLFICFSFGSGINYHHHMSN